LPFKCNLQRYIAARAQKAEDALKRVANGLQHHQAVGLYTLNAVDP
jgi:hypothetical protein